MQEINNTQYFKVDVDSDYDVAVMSLHLFTLP